MGAGEDTLLGGAGNDTLTGGADDVSPKNQSVVVLKDTAPPQGPKAAEGDARVPALPREPTRLSQSLDPVPLQPP